MITVVGAKVDHGGWNYRKYIVVVTTTDYFLLGADPPVTQGDPSLGLSGAKWPTAPFYLSSHSDIFSISGRIPDMSNLRDCLGGTYR